jgi:hypothetical protein
MEADVGEHAVVEIEQCQDVSTAPPIIPEFRDQARDRPHQPGKPGPNFGGAGLCRGIDSDAAHVGAPLTIGFGWPWRAVRHRDGAPAFHGAFQRTWISRQPIVDSSRWRRDRRWAMADSAESTLTETSFETSLLHLISVRLRR